MYTVMMVDANPVGTDESSTEQTRHWLVNGATLGGAAPYAVNYTGSTSVCVFFLLPDFPSPLRL